MSLADVKACAQHVSGEMHLQVLKLSEEAGEAAGAYIGWTGNPRPGKEATREEFVYEVCDVALAAMVILENLGEDSQNLIWAHAGAVLARFESGQPTEGGTAEPRTPNLIHEIKGRNTTRSGIAAGTRSRWSLRQRWRRFCDDVDAVIERDL